MTYASLILPYDPIKYDVAGKPKLEQTLKGRLTSALKKAGQTVKNGLTNPTQTLKTLTHYFQDNQDMILNKFSGIAVAQMLVSGNVSNKQALDYLFLGFAPAMGQTAVAMGYMGISQMKDAMKNGKINVASFVSGFMKAQKAIVDLKNGQRSKNTITNKRLIQIDITLTHDEQYQSEAPDRRVQNGTSWSEVIHNMPEVFSLQCGLQDGKRYTKAEFKEILTFLRKKKTPFDILLDDESKENVMLLNFNPSVVGARSGYDYNLELKKINIGSIELVPITIQPLPTSETTGTKTNGKKTQTSTPKTNPNSPASPAGKKLEPPQAKSLHVQVAERLEEQKRVEAEIRQAGM